MASKGTYKHRWGALTDWLCQWVEGQPHLVDMTSAAPPMRKSTLEGR